MREQYEAKVFYETYHERFAFSLPAGVEGWKQRARLRTLQNLLPSPAGKTLFVGCGNGMEMEFLGLPAVGIDIAQTAVQAALQRCTDSTFAVADAHRLPFSDGSFEVVICSEVLEHLWEPEAALAEMVRVLSPWGMHHYHA